MASLFGFREFQNKCKMQLSDLVMFFKKMLWWFEGCFQNIGSVKNVPPMQCRVCKRNCDTWTRERKGWRIKKDFCEQRVCGHGKTSGLCLWTLTIEIREAGTTAVYKKRNRANCITPLSIWLNSMFPSPSLRWDPERFNSLQDENLNDGVHTCLSPQSETCEEVEFEFGI